jgi:hypothetical protein
LVRELEKMQGGQPAAEPAPTQRSTGPINPRLLPDVSAVGDIVGDFSPDGSTQEDGRRFSIREIELAVQAAVDPYFRGDIFLGISDEEGISVEQAYLTATSLPWSLEARLGRYLMPVGKVNTTHRHDLHTVEYPWVVQRFFGPEGLKGTGVWVSRIFSPFGFYQELQLTAVDQFGETEGLFADTPVNKRLSGLGYSARLRNYWDLSQSTNIEWSASAITGKRLQPISCLGVEGETIGCPEEDGAMLGAAARQTVVGTDFTFRWRPLQEGLYRSFILQAEVMRQINETDPRLPSVPEVNVVLFDGPTRDVTGAYAFARYQLTRRAYLGARYDFIGREAAANDNFHAASGYLEFFPSEFSKLLAGYERVMPGTGEQDYHRILVQASFALGPHKPHPF